jgi:serine/threonine-protein kinase
MVSEWIGNRLGRYRVAGIVGQGAMGVVVRGHDPDLERTVAIKILYPHLVADKELVERFRREARTAANLHHRSIVAIHDVGRENDRHYLVMEFLEGKPLSKIIDEQGPLSPKWTLVVIEQIASALDYIHKQKLVHRDVKASNILVDREDRAVLTDFGLARSVAGSDLTASGTIVGTPHYITPEQVSGGEVGPWTDLYALGVVAYEMLTGQFPFEADPLTALLFQVLWAAPPPIEVPTAAHPEALNNVIQRALAKEPTDRYPSGAAFVDALRQALVEKGEAAPAAAPGRPARRPSRPRPADRLFPRWLLGLLGGAVLLLLVGAVFLTGAFPFPGTPTPRASAPRVAATMTTSSVLVPTSPPVIPQASPSPPQTPFVTTLVIAPATTVPLATPATSPTPGSTTTRTAIATPTPTRIVTRPPPTPLRTPTLPATPTLIPPTATATFLPSPEPTERPTREPTIPPPPTEPTATLEPPTITPPPLPTITPPSR